MINKSKKYAIEKHNSINQKYDGLPYGDSHLANVFDVGENFASLLCKNREEILSSLWLHDVLEDVYSVTYNDLKSEFGVIVADIVYAVSNEKGKTRSERANDKYYEGIRNTNGAVFVKLCDRIANVQYSKMTKSRMYDVYKKENEHFIHSLGVHPQHEYQKMFDYLIKLLND